MASKFWVGNGGNVSDTNHWSLTSGGSGGAGSPTSSDDVVLDANSITLGSQTIVIDVDLDVKSLTTTGVLNTPTINMASILNLYGNITVSGVTFSNSSAIQIQADSTMTTNGITMPRIFNISGTVNLADAISTTGGTFVVFGTLNTNNFSMTTDGGIDIEGTVNLGSSSISFGALSVITGSGILNAGTSTITMSSGQLDDFTTGHNFTFYNVVLTQSATIYNSNTFNTLTLTAGKSYSFLGGSVTTVSNLSAVGSVGNMITLQRFSSGTWTLSKTSGNLNVYYCNISNSIATGGAVFRAYDSNDQGNNTGWNFWKHKAPADLTHTSSLTHISTLTHRVPTTFR